MQARAAELRAEGKNGAKKADSLQIQDAANFDDGEMWPVSYALQWSPAVEKQDHVNGTVAAITSQQNTETVPQF